MKPRLLFLLILFVCAAPILYAQYSVGFDMEFNRDRVKISDPGNEIKKSPRFNASPGLAYRFRFKKKFHIASGIRIKDYPHNLTANHSLGTSSGSGNIVLQLPLRLGYSFNLSKILSFSPELGLTCNRFLFKEPGNGELSIGTAADTITYTWRTVNSRMTFFTLNFGLSFEFKFSKQVSIVFTGQYNQGFIPVGREYVTYRFNQDAPVNAEQVHYGSYFTFFGARLLFHLVRSPY